MKSDIGDYVDDDTKVAPFTGAWIEIAHAWWVMSDDEVAPFTGAWIEIGSYSVAEAAKMSLPSRERGLKYHAREHVPPLRVVAPFTGAWIEMVLPAISSADAPGRSLHGSVD